MSDECPNECPACSAEMDRDYEVMRAMARTALTCSSLTGARILDLDRADDERDTFWGTVWVECSDLIGLVIDPGELIDLVCDALAEEAERGEMRVDFGRPDPAHPYWQRLHDEVWTEPDDYFLKRAKIAVLRALESPESGAES